MTTNNKELISPFSGTRLVPTEKDNMFYDKSSGIYYMMTKDGELLGLKSFHSGAILLPTQKDNLFYDEHTHLYYMYTDDEKLICLKSPTSNLALSMNEDGTYSSKDGATFILDKRGFIPTFMPDDSHESAHIEGNFLVGNSTGRRYPIKEDGRVIIPELPINIQENASPDQIHQYFAKRRETYLSMTQEEIDDIIAYNARRNEMDYEELKKRLQRELDEHAQNLKQEVEALKVSLAEQKEERKRTFEEQKRQELVDYYAEITSDSRSREIALFLLNMEEKINNGQSLTDDEIKKLICIRDTGYLPDDEKSDDIDNIHKK